MFQKDLERVGEFSLPPALRFWTTWTSTALQGAGQMVHVRGLSRGLPVGDATKI